MKSKDIALIVVIAIISAVLSILLSSFLLPSSKNRSTSVEVVTPLSAEFTRPPKKFFNNESINPTQTIQIESNQDNNPIGQN